MDSGRLNLSERLKILADAAKYDVSCASSGHQRKHKAGTTGSTSSSGICHSFSADGRCISLLKLLMTNYCLFDCAYCINRSSNDRPRARLSADELVELTMGFYRRNYIEGLFLSSGIIRNADYTMEQLMLVAKKLREDYHFNGYIHLKAIPGASDDLIRQAGYYADRMSENIEIPSEAELIRLAPDKNYHSVYHPMNQLKESIQEYRQDRRKHHHTPEFIPAGQSTQLIVGATPDTDQTILQLSSRLYDQQKLKRVYYSGYLPVNSYDQRLPALQSPPLLREHRLYQSDWLMRFYQFSASELLSDEQPMLDTAIDPKLAYALRHPELFPVDVNRADYHLLLRVPGIGVKSAQYIIQARRHRQLNSGHLKKIGVVLKRACYFISCHELNFAKNNWYPEQLRQLLSGEDQTARHSGQKPDAQQLQLF